MKMGVSRSVASAIVACLLLVATIELLTCLLRFGLHLEATRDTGALGALTFGLRIHHSYVGVVLMILGLLLARGIVLRWLLIVGGALVVSDLVHHFLVLWLATGSPQFDLFYS
jgi:hypothetical protein